MLNLDKYLIEQGPFDPAAMSYAEARSIADAHRKAHGLSDSFYLLSEPGDISKLALGEWLLWAISLNPAMSSGVANVCNHSTKGCRHSCVAQNGNGAYPHTDRVRTWRTKFLYEHPQAFVTIWDHETARAVARYGDDYLIGERPNAYSDLRWELIAPAVFERHPTVHFYDYTKWPISQRYVRSIPNYKLTYSHTDEKGTRVRIGKTFNTAVVFPTKKGDPLPDSYKGIPVLDGDATDERFTDPEGGHIIGLRAKGRARRDKTGFVVTLPESK